MRALPESYYINREEAIYQFPMLNAEGLKGACNGGGLACVRMCEVVRIACRAALASCGDLAEDMWPPRAQNDCIDAYVVRHELFDSPLFFSACPTHVTPPPQAP